MFQLPFHTALPYPPYSKQTEDEESDGFHDSLSIDRTPEGFVRKVHNPNISGFVLILIESLFFTHPVVSLDPSNQQGRLSCRGALSRVSKPEELAWLVFKEFSIPCYYAAFIGGH